MISMVFALGHEPPMSEPPAGSDHEPHDIFAGFEKSEQAPAGIAAFTQPSFARGPSMTGYFFARAVAGVIQWANGKSLFSACVKAGLNRSCGSSSGFWTFARPA